MKQSNSILSFATRSTTETGGGSSALPSRDKPNQTKKSSWSAIDIAAIDEVRSWMQLASPQVSIKDYAQLMGCSYPRAVAQFHHQYAPLSLGDLTKICEHFGKNPGLAWMQIIDRSSKIGGVGQDEVQTLTKGSLESLGNQPSTEPRHRTDKEKSNQTDAV